MNFMRSNGNWEGRMLVQGLMNNSIFHHLTCNIYFFRNYCDMFNKFRKFAFQLLDYLSR